MRKTILSLGATATSAAVALVLASGASPEAGGRPAEEGVDMKSAPVETSSETGSYHSFDYQLVSVINAWPKKYTGVGIKADSNEVAVEGITL